MATVKELKQKIKAKWGTIKDPNTQKLIDELLSYTASLEQKLESPDNPIPKVGPRPMFLPTISDFREGIDLDSLSSESSSDSESTRGLVEQLLDFGQDLEQRTDETNSQ